MYRERDAWEFIAALPRSFYVATLTSIDQLDQWSHVFWKETWRLQKAFIVVLLSPACKRGRLEANAWILKVSFLIWKAVNVNFLKCYCDQIFTSWFFRCIAQISMKEWKRRLPFANTCIGSGDIQVWKMCKLCKWDDWWCHTLNRILRHFCKWSYLGQFAAQIIETWQTNSSIENTPKAIKHFVALATHSFPVPNHLISICKWFSARKPLYEATNSS